MVVCLKHFVFLRGDSCSLWIPFNGVPTGDEVLRGSEISRVSRRALAKLGVLGGQKMSDPWSEDVAVEILAHVVEEERRRLVAVG